MIPIDYTQRFMHNYKNSDFAFFKNGFESFKKEKENFIINDNVPHNYNKIIFNGNKNYLYELGKFHSQTILTTDNHKKKCNYIDSNLFFEKKYCLMYPTSSLLGEEQDKNYSQKMKKIGDISFEEEPNINENVKNLSRLPPENITEEWIKSNLNNKVELLRIENCYWLSKDLISKIGRLNTNLKELCLRNLDIDNNTLYLILKWLKNLEILDISYCNDLSIGTCASIKENCSRLKSLKAVSLIKAMTNNELEYISNLNQLEEIDISLCNNIDDNGLILFSKNKKQKIKHINLTGLLKLTNKGLIEIISNNNQTLNKLILSLLPQKSVDGNICSEISKCKNLTLLDLSGCINISADYSGNLFSSGLEKLENLNLSGISLINDSVIEAAMTTNKLLKVLRISNCTLLTNNILEYIMHNSNDLLLLELNRTPLISQNLINETIKKRAPNLRIIRVTNNVWNLKNLGLKVPLMPTSYVKPMMKGSKAPVKKNDEKNPINQLKRILEEVKPKRIIDFKL